jgi:DNA-binding transcriptional MocR family regulator
MLDPYKLSIEESKPWSEPLSLPSIPGMQGNSPPFEPLTPEDTILARETLTKVGAPFFPTDTIISIPNSYLYGDNQPSILFRASYDIFVKSPQVLSGLRSSWFEIGPGANLLGLFNGLIENTNEVTLGDERHLQQYARPAGYESARIAVAEALSAQRQSIWPGSPPIQKEQVCFSNGMQGAFTLLAKYLAAQPSSHQQTILAPGPTYPMLFAPFLSEGFRVSVIEKSINGDLVPINDFINKIEQSRPAAVMYVPFTNPTGEKYTKDELEQLLNCTAKTGTIVIYNESCDELSVYGTPDSRPSSELVQLEASGAPTDHVVRIRGLSKVTGFAGVRGGYLIGPRTMVSMLNTIQATMNFAPNAQTSMLLGLVEGLLAARDDNNFLFKNSQLRNANSAICHLFGDFHRRLELQQNIIQSRVNQLAEWVTGEANTTLVPGAVLEGTHFDMRVPKGGYNVWLHLKQLYNYDPVDVMRSMFLMTGGLIHPTPVFTCNPHEQPQLWTRVTITVPEPDFLRTLKAIDYACTNLPAAELKPFGTYSFRCSSSFAEYPDIST